MKINNPNKIYYQEKFSKQILVGARKINCTWDPKFVEEFNKKYPLTVKEVFKDENK